MILLNRYSKGGEFLNSWNSLPLLSNKKKGLVLSVLSDYVVLRELD